MNIAVWDTYVARQDGRSAHFDILVPASLKDQDQVYAFGNEYLETKGIAGSLLSAAKCSFCHIEQGSPEQEAAIETYGYAVIELEHCD